MPRTLAVESLEARCLPTSAQFVTSIYVDLLGRNPSTNELNAQVSAINTGGQTPVQFAFSVLNSEEFVTDTIRADYQSLLQRNPSPQELAFWLAQRQAGLSGRQEAVSFLASDEYFRLQGATPTAWLNAVFQTVLGRSPDPSAVASFGQGTQVGAVRANAARSIVFSPEGSGRIVDAAFARLLERNADPSGLNFWVGELVAGLSVPAMQALLAGSSEYLNLKAGGGVDVNRPNAPLPFPVPPPARVVVPTIRPVSTAVFPSVPLTFGTATTLVPAFGFPPTTTVLVPGPINPTFLNFGFSTFIPSPFTGSLLG
jgi:hypothetical protein